VGVYCTGVALTVREYLMYYRGPGFLAVIPPPLPPPNKQVVSLFQSSCVSPVEFTDGRGGGKGEGAKLYDGEKPWSSIYHSILSAYSGMFLYS
jgi:hypothetical protein